MRTSLNDIIGDYPEVTGVHQACLAVPDMSDEDFEKLAESIGTTGLANEVLLSPEGLLVDGRNRLIACWEKSIEVRFKTTSVDPWIVAVNQNIARRHLTVGQKAAFAEAMFAYEAAEARKRQEATQAKPGQKVGGGRPSTTLGDTGKARDAAGAAVGVSGRSVDRFRAIKEELPEVAADVASGKLSLEAGYGMARKKRASRDKSHIGAADSPAPIAAETTTIVTAKGVRSEIALPKVVRFNKTNDSVSWASWTWNPVTGCEHGCRFCYAREIAHSERMAPYYPNKFEPTFHEYRLEAPANTSVPLSADERDRRVFVCSMADLFGKWVPDEWIEKVFDACLESPEWTYLFLTKWPARYSRMPLLESAWYGASVVQQSDVSRVEKAMENFDTPGCVKWISLEPMLEPIKFDNLSWCNLIVIGAQTVTNQPDGLVPAFSPKFEWVADVVSQARGAGVPVYLKENLLSSPGMDIPQESPSQAPCLEPV